MITHAFPEVLATPAWVAGTAFGLWIGVYVLLLFGGTVLNLLGLAGNWVMTAGAFVHVLLADPQSRTGTGFGVPLTMLGLALIGEGLEFIAGLLGAGKAGGSRRAMILSMLGGIVGSLFGFSIGNVFIPIVGGVAGVLLVGGLGALAGAVLGETWKGRTFSDSMRVGRSAFTGRILGTLAKTFIGALIFLIGLFSLIV